MDVVIPFQNSVTGDEELRYALRSALLHIPYLNNVFIFGNAPAWPHTTELIIVNSHNVSKSPYFKDKNIACKLLAACDTAAVSDTFIILHDDNYLLQPFNYETYYHKGRAWQGGDGMYAQVEWNTRELLGHDINNYDLHAPHAVNKYAFKNSIGKLDWNRRFGYCIKTAYAVLNGISGTLYSDLKLHAPFSPEELNNMVRGRAFFSTNDTFIKPWTTAWLRTLYPLKSKYEA